MVLTVSFVISPVIGFVSPSSCASERKACRQRRGVRTTRLRRPRSAPFVSGAYNSVHCIPSRVRDDRERPSVGRDGPIRKVFCCKDKRIYFFDRGWTGDLP